jgi:hypothetical protein
MCPQSVDHFLVQAMGLLLRLITIDESVFCIVFPQPVRGVTGPGIAALLWKPLQGEAFKT